MGKTDALFTRPSFMTGMARAIDIFAGLDDYNACETPEEADAHALYADWLAIGSDLQIAMESPGKSVLSR